MDEKLFYTRDSFCKAAGISPVTFYRWTKLPGFPIVRCGRKILVPRREAEVWISAQVGNNLRPEGVNGGRTV